MNTKTPLENTCRDVGSDPVKVFHERLGFTLPLLMKLIERNCMLLEIDRLQRQLQALGPLEGEGIAGSEECRDLIRKADSQLVEIDGGGHQLLHAIKCLLGGRLPEEEAEDQHRNGVIIGPMATGSGN